MTLKLHASWGDRLRQLPETGMGYQVLALEGLTIRPEHVVVANAGIAIEVVRGRYAVREGVEKATQDRIERLLLGEVSKARFQVLSRTHAVVAKVIESRGALGTGPASGAPIEDSHPDERFLRFSAYADDVRIQADGSVSPGTYVTTFADGLTVSTGTEAVRRYALPNPEPAVHRFYLKPPGPIEVQRGTAQPAFGQPGGGAEIIFTDGAPPGTRYKQDEIPPR